MIRTLKIQFVHWQKMQHHVAEQAPLEACGLLAGKKDGVEAVLRMRNTAQSPVRFRMDAQEQYNAFMWIEDSGLDLVGIYHSHPAGPEVASATDIAEAAYEVVHIIWSRTENNWDVHGFWFEAEKVTEVNLQVLGNSNL
jgi:proteasome lid subunit RPN8/RPN11